MVSIFTFTFLLWAPIYDYQAHETSVYNITTWTAYVQGAASDKFHLIAFWITGTAFGCG